MPDTVTLSPTAARPPLPPFDHARATEKVRLAEDAWNSRDPARVALGYTIDSAWRNRAEFLQGREAIVQFLTRKWARELEYRLIKELWAYREHRIAVRFAYEWRDDSGQWYRSYGNENWEFDEHGRMARRMASITTCRSARATGASCGGSGAGPTIIPASPSSTCRKRDDARGGDHPPRASR